MSEQTPLSDDVPSRAYEWAQAIGATTISLAVAAVLGAWAMTQQGTGGSPAPADGGGQPQTTTTAQLGGGSRPLLSGAGWVGDVAPRSGAGTGDDQVAGGAVYLVASQQQADELRAGLEEGSAIREALGLPPFDGQIVVFGSEEEEAQFWLSRAEEETVRFSLGLPPLRVVDLRGEGRGAVPRAITSPDVPPRE